MDIKEILQRPSPANYTVRELEFAIEKYIEQKKGVQVNVNVHKNMSNPLKPEDIFKLDMEYSNLMTAFNIVQQNYIL